VPTCQPATRASLLHWMPCDATSRWRRRRRRRRRPFPVLDLTSPPQSRMCGWLERDWMDQDAVDSCDLLSEPRRMLPPTRLLGSQYRPQKAPWGAHPSPNIAFRLAQRRDGPRGDGNVPKLPASTRSSAWGEHPCCRVAWSQGSQGTSQEAIISGLDDCQAFVADSGSYKDSATTDIAPPQPHTVRGNVQAAAAGVGRLLGSIVALTNLPERQELLG
jgi:hypothetical protein